MYKLCTAEKPSVARDIANVVGANKLEDGYYIGNGYIVTWCIGHLITLSEPSAYGEEYVDRRNIDVLPVIPTIWKTNVIESVKKQYNVIKKLMHREDVDLIIDCGDMGETGHYLQWLVRREAKCNKPVKRFCATSLTEESIRHHMNNLRDIEEFEGIIKGAYCKSKADWILGMNFSRLYSTLYNTNLTLGRVQTPTLTFVLKRYFEVVNFKPVPYYQIKGDFNGINAILLTENKNQISKRETAEQILQDLKGIDSAKVTKLETLKKAVDRPMLYDITELQRDANKKFSYSPDEVLKTAQSLYEKHKVLSYPRTDSRYITSDLVAYMETRIKEISTISTYTDASKYVLSKGLNIDGKIVNDAKVTDHHALVVTEKIKDFNMNTLDEKEKNILNLVITRMLVSFSHKYLYQQTEINLLAKKYLFGASGKMPVSLEWRYIEQLLNGKEEQEDTDNQVFPNIALGQVISINSMQILSKQTTPPLLHTEGTLLTAMENAGATIKDNNGYKEILKGHGIGTQATRAEIIKKLFDVGYVEYKVKGKTKYIVPTKKGINSFKIFPIELMSPTLTAEWETKIHKVAKGEYSEEQFMNDIKAFVNNLFVQAKSNIDNSLSFKKEKEVIGSCPYCSKDIYENKTSYYCSDYEHCNFSFFKDAKFITSKTKKNFTKNQFQKLITPKGLTVTCTSDGGAKYKMNFKVINNKTNKFVQLDMTLQK